MIVRARTTEFHGATQRVSATRKCAPLSNAGPIDQRGVICPSGSLVAGPRVTQSWPSRAPASELGFQVRDAVRAAAGPRELQRATPALVQQAWIGAGFDQGPDGRERARRGGVQLQRGMPVRVAC